MSNIFYTIQQGFSRGEISPEFTSRSDFQGYNYSLQLARNVNITQSNMTIRAGMKYIDTVGIAGNNYLMSKLLFSSNEIYFAIIQEGKISLYNFFTDEVEQVIIFNATNEEIPNIRFTFFSLALIITRQSQQPQVLSFDNTKIVGDKFSLNTYSYSQQPLFNYDTTIYASARFELSSSSNLNTGKSATLTITNPNNTTFRFSEDYVGGIYSSISNDQLNAVGTFNINTFISGTEVTGTVGNGFTNTEDSGTKIINAIGENVVLSRDAFSNDTGYPLLVDGFQNRIMFCNIDDIPTGVWTSQTANASSFDTGTGKDSDAIVFSIQEQGVSQIYHVIGNKTLQFSTNNGLYVFDTAYTGGLTPSNINLVSANKYNYDSVFKPTVYNSVSIGLIEGGKSLMGTTNDGTDQYTTSQINVMSTHICNYPKFSAIFDGQVESLSTIAMFVNSDGTLLTYQNNNEQNINGYSLHTTGTDNEDKFINILNVDDVIYFLIERNGNVLLEKIDFNSRLDSYIDKESTIPFNIVEGLDHLEGRTVMALITNFDNGGYGIDSEDGYIVVKNLLVTDGQVELPTEVLSARVGLFFTPKIQPLKPIMPMGQMGSMFYQKKKRYKVDIEYLNSFGVEVIDDIGNIWKDSQLDWEESAFKPPVQNNGILSFTLGEGWTNDLKDFTITQSLPFNFTIKGITQHIQSEDEF
jgi:hypothetical protein